MVVSLGVGGDWWEWWCCYAHISIISLALSLSVALSLSLLAFQQLSQPHQVISLSLSLTILLTLKVLDLLPQFNLGSHRIHTYRTQESKPSKTMI